MIMPLICKAFVAAAMVASKKKTNFILNGSE
jgi:hypothetical protein